MNKLTKYSFSDLYSISSGISSTKEQAGHGFPFVSFSTVFNNYFLPEHLTDKMMTSNDEQNKFSILKGDILLTRTSETIDELAMSSVALMDYPKTTFSGFLKRLRPKDKTSGIAYHKFMAFYLRSDLFRKIITNNASMTLRASFNKIIFSFLNLYLPQYNDQVKIGNLLYDIEMKIQNNNKVNEILEKQIHSVYMHYFVRKKSNGRLSDILIENQKSKIYVNDVEELPGDYPFFTSGSSILECNDYLVDNRNIYLNTGGNADIKFYVGKTAYSTDTWCISAKYDLEDYLFLLLKTIKNELNIKYFQGTGLKHLQKDLLKNRKIYIPNESEAKLFNQQAKPIMENISMNTQENKKLSKLREWLLPLFMNGQATVSE